MHAHINANPLAPDTSTHLPVVKISPYFSWIIADLFRICFVSLGVLYFFLDADYFFDVFFSQKKYSAQTRYFAPKKYSALKKYSDIFFCEKFFFLAQMPQNFRSGQKSVMGDSLGTSGGMWCVRGPRDGTDDQASLILTPPPPPCLDLHPVSPISTFLRTPTTSTLFLGRLLPTRTPQKAGVM